MPKRAQEPRIEEIVKLIRPVTPEVTPERLTEIVAQVASVNLTQRLLELALIKQPGVLEGRHTNVPQTVQKLAHALKAEGATRVVLPTCESCGRAVLMPNVGSGGGRRCSRCDRNARATQCTTCGLVRPVQRTLDGLAYCRECWRADPRSFALCALCHRQATIIARRPHNICLACYKAPIKVCQLCGQRGRIASHMDGRRVCARCYYAMRTPRSCPECGLKVLLTGFMGGQSVCAVCAGTPVTMACPQCGSIEEARKHHLCARCRRPLVIQQLLADETGQIRHGMEPLAAYLRTHHGSAASLERWVHKSRAAAVLRELAEGALPLNADAIIDRVEVGQSAAFLLSLLVRAGVLPEFDIQAARFDHWVRHWLPTVAHPEDRLILRQYCAWELQPANTPRTASRSHPRSSSRHQRLRSALQQCARLLNEIRTEGATVMTYPQRKLDQFLTGSPNQQDALAPFTRWLRRHRLSNLRVEARPSQLEGRHYASDHRWSMARTFLTAPDMDPLTRSAGLLVLLYGLHITRITTLTRNHVDTTTKPATLTVGVDPIQLPEILEDALTEIWATAQRNSTEWLFPGRNPGRPITPESLSRRLRHHGLRAGSARVTALMELTRQMHPRVVSDLLGITAATASAWSRLSGGEWSDYPALRNA